jgi:hypothetical protein
MKETLLDVASVVMVVICLEMPINGTRMAITIMAIIKLAPIAIA